MALEISSRRVPDIEVIRHPEEHPDRAEELGISVRGLRPQTTDLVELGMKVGSHRRYNVRSCRHYRGEGICGGSRTDRLECGRDRVDPPERCRSHGTFATHSRNVIGD